MNKVLKDIRRKRKIKKKFNNVCVYCNCNNSLIMTLDHVEPISRGGTNEESNLVACCYVCNHLKGNLTSKEFKLYLKSLINLHKLTKIRIKLFQVTVEFNQNYIPNFNKEVKKDETK